MMARATPLRGDQLPAGLWGTTVPVRWGMCDPAGIVYTPSFFDLFLGVVEDWFCEALAIDYHAVLRDRRIGLGYAQAGCQFFATCTHGERLCALVGVDHVGRASLALTVHALKDDREAVRGELVIVTTSLADHRPVPLPGDIRAALERYRSGPSGATASPA